jgi:hypothetical protein
MNQHHYIHPSSSAAAMLIEKLCNSVTIKILRRAIFKYLPFLKMKSEVEGVVYVNWLIDTGAITQFVPNNVSLIDIDGKTILSVLTYKHGNFRPSILSFIRFIFPSPFQSNWRLYVSSLNNKTTSNTVLFIKNIMSSTLYTVGTRLFSDSMQTHLAKIFIHQIKNNKTKTQITKGTGSSPDFICNTEFSDTLNIPSKLAKHFGSDNQVIKYLCLQKYALNEGNDFKGICKAKIDLPIDINQIIPLSVTSLESKWLKTITQEATPFAFLVPNVKFEVLNEQMV